MLLFKHVKYGGPAGQNPTTLQSTDTVQASCGLLLLEVTTLRSVNTSHTQEKHVHSSHTYIYIVY